LLPRTPKPHERIFSIINILPDYFWIYLYIN